MANNSPSAVPVQPPTCGYPLCGKPLDADRVARGARYCNAVCKKRADSYRAHQRKKRYLASVIENHDRAVLQARAAKQKIAELEARIAELEKPNDADKWLRKL